VEAVTIDAVLGEMTPDEIRELPRFIDVWLQAGRMQPEEAVEWRLRARAWAEYRQITPESEPF
jgi:hypothetical protein